MTLSGSEFSPEIILLVAFTGSVIILWCYQIFLMIIGNDNNETQNRSEERRNRDENFGGQEIENFQEGLEFFDGAGGDLTYPDVEVTIRRYLQRSMKKRSKLTHSKDFSSEGNNMDLKKVKSASEIRQGDDTNVLRRRTSVL